MQAVVEDRAFEPGNARKKLRFASRLRVPKSVKRLRKAMSLRPLPLVSVAAAQIGAGTSGLQAPPATDWMSHTPPTAEKTPLTPPESSGNGSISGLAIVFA